MGFTSIALSFFNVKIKKHKAKGFEQNKREIRKTKCVESEKTKMRRSKKENSKTKGVIAYEKSNANKLNKYRERKIKKKKNATEKRQSKLCGLRHCIIFSI